MRSRPLRLPLMLISLPIVVGACGLALGAGVGVLWSRSDVIPVVLVKPGISGFQPVERSSVENTWTKSEVKAVVIVTPGIGGFVPKDSIGIGNSWSRQDVIPVVLAEPSMGGFAAIKDVTDTKAGLPTVQTPVPEPPAGPVSTASVIEGQISGEFEGWDGDTIVKLTNGQIWQQTEYHYHYHYAFMPKVLIYRLRGQYRMKVDGVDRAVAVTRLR
ncbi:MAG TPA: hypothetical protein VEB03_00545 [Candidatus Nanoarchaeia archaeon]|nr:hypothetical protein [Candidatus Nanoarchaeia archaeon]